MNKASRELSDGSLYSHYIDVLELEWPWENFTPEELACNKTGEFYWHARTFDALQLARDILGKPLYINSAHRNWLHNIAIGGAPGSAHLFVAVDISTRGHNLFKLYTALRKAGFTSFGFYRTFIHCDLRAGRMWFGLDPIAKKIWGPIIRSYNKPDVLL